MQKDYWDKFEKLHEDTTRTLKETKPEVFTKEFTMRMRLNRDLNAPFEKDGHEYGNYAKYEANSVEVKHDEGLENDGEKMFFRNYQNMLKSMDIAEGYKIKHVDRKSIAKTIENYKFQSFEAVDKFAYQREKYDYKD